jgi:formylglycine-generating enzyme required for sulfatase activity
VLIAMAVGAGDQPLVLGVISMNLLRCLATAALVALILASLAVPDVHAVTIDMVTVGDPGNAADTSGYGAVNYEYQIGKYEVTIGQYTDFLNSVASDDPNGLYDVWILNGGNVAGISRDGVPGAYTYNADGPRGQVFAGANSPRNRPVTYTSWYDAARFANWMSNGQPTGPQNATTTENGVYNLTNVSRGQAPPRNAINPNNGLAPAFFIPTENEWYKAAYYSPTLNAGQGGYYAYATQSDTLPGNLIGGGANQANWYNGEKYSVMQVREGSPSGQQNYLTNVGAFTASPSFYGTFDQNGNVLEWNDLSALLGTKRGLRGGGWQGYFGWTQLSAFSRETANPEDAYQVVGFRLAAPVPVPEPSTWVMGAAGLVCAGFGAWQGRNRS